MPQAVGFALFQLGASLAVVNFVTIGLGATLINVAVGIGLSLVAGRLLRPDVPSAPELKPSDVQSPIRQAVPPRIRSYGTVRLAGVVFWREADEPNEILYLGQLVNAGRIGSFDQLLIDNRIVTIDGAGQVQTSPYNTVTTEILTRLGEDPETAYSEIETAFGYESVRGDGVASMLGRFESFASGQTQQENYPNVIPQLKATISASVVWDWRDPNQLREDDSTWEFSDNPVVCALDYLMHPDGFAIPWSRFESNISQWTAEADKCDVMIGDEKRFRLALTYDYSQQPGQVLDQILRSCDAKVWPRSDGTIGIKVGVFDGSRVEIRSADVLGYRVTRGQDRLTAVAGVRATYMEPAQQYFEAEAQPWPSAAAVAALGEERVRRLDLAMVPSENQARRLMQIAYKRETAPVRLTMTTTLAGERCIDERWIRVDLPERNIAADFEIEDLQVDYNTGRCVMELVQHVPFVEEEAGTVDPDTFRIAGRGAITWDGMPPALDYDTVTAGEAPQVGDLVVWLVSGQVTYTEQSGWTTVDETVYESLVTRIAFMKVVDSADLASPTSPLSGGSGSDGAAHWFAIRNFTGTPAHGNFVSDSEPGAKPPALDFDLSAVAGPLVVLSWFSILEDSVLTSPKWIGDTPTAEVSTIFVMSLAAVYDEGETGPDLQLDMADEGSINVLGGFEVHFT